MACELRIGTSGWHYKHWRGPFYPVDLPAAQMLRVYEEHFDTVEVNNSFYHLPLAGTFDNWRRLSPPDFCFAVKASRYLTHMKRLKDAEEGVHRFFPLVERLEEKLGPILFQLPPRWPCDTDRLRDFLSILPQQHRYTFEFRDTSWHTSAVYRLLAKHNIAFCIYDSAAYALTHEITTDFAYIRFHGTASGNYDSATVRRWSELIQNWQRTLKAIYVYFNNDVYGYAVRNALELKEQLSGVAPGHFRSAERY